MSEPDSGLRVVGAGVGRTGTTSLKAALEQLLGGRCYHMLEVFADPEHLAWWKEAGEGGDPWSRLFDGFVATVDWPSAAYWREISNAYPDALVLLSTRENAEAWWRSASKTIFLGMDGEGVPRGDEWRDSVVEPMMARFTMNWADHDSAVAAYEQHNAAVRKAIGPDRLLEWRPGDGWEPLCDRLGLPVPGDPFPHTNTTEDFRQLMGLDD
jgi:Sulfotransferase domain